MHVPQQKVTPAINKTAHTPSHTPRHQTQPRASQTAPPRARAGRVPRKNPSDQRERPTGLGWHGACAFGLSRPRASRCATRRSTERRPYRRPQSERQGPAGAAERSGLPEQASAKRERSEGSPHAKKSSLGPVWHVLDAFSIMFTPYQPSNLQIHVKTPQKLLDLQSRFTRRGASGAATA